MTTFFDPTDASHLALVPKAQRAHEELPTIAADAEADVIAHYTRRQSSPVTYSDNFYRGAGYSLGNGVYVCLEGFNPDASQVTDADLVLALRRTIADVITWRLGKIGENAAFTSVSTAIGVSKTKHEAFAHPFPPTDWPYRLRRWDLRQPVYSL